eukprot:m.21112 g.21112  ORF g.21112 m.21112 type:complete len:60 (-) comp8243_c0_seq2:1240-1419(-)
MTVLIGTANGATTLIIIIGMDDHDVIIRFEEVFIVMVDDMVVMPWLLPLQLCCLVALIH